MKDIRASPLLTSKWLPSPAAWHSGLSPQPRPQGPLLTYAPSAAMNRSPSCLGNKQKGTNNNVVHGHHSTIICLALTKQLPAKNRHARVIKAHLQRELSESLRPTWAETGCSPPQHRIAAVHPPLPPPHRHCQDCSKHTARCCAGH